MLSKASSVSRFSLKRLPVARASMKQVCAPRFPPLAGVERIDAKPPVAFKRDGALEDRMAGRVVPQSAAGDAAHHAVVDRIPLGDRARVTEVEQQPCRVGVAHVAILRRGGRRRGWQDAPKEGRQG